MEVESISPAPHYTAKIIAFLSTLGVLLQSYVAYIQTQDKSLHAILQVKEFVKVIVYIVYSILVYRYRDTWNGGGWGMTLLFVFFLFGMIQYALMKIVDMIFTVSLQEAITGEEKK